MKSKQCIKVLLCYCINNVIIFIIKLRREKFIIQKFDGHSILVGNTGVGKTHTLINHLSSNDGRNKLIVHEDDLNEYGQEIKELKEKGYQHYDLTDDLISLYQTRGHLEKSVVQANLKEYKFDSHLEYVAKFIETLVINEASRFEKEGIRSEWDIYIDGSKATQMLNYVSRNVFAVCLAYGITFYVTALSEKDIHENLEEVRLAQFNQYALS